MNSVFKLSPDKDDIRERLKDLHGQKNVELCGEPILHKSYKYVQQMEVPESDEVTMKEMRK